MSIYALNSPPEAAGPWNQTARGERIRQRLFGSPRVRFAEYDDPCPSPSVSPSTTPDSSLPATPLDEMAPSGFKLYGFDHEGPSHPPDGDTLEKKGSLSRALRKIGSTIRKGSLRKRSASARMDDVRDIFRKASPAKKHAPAEPAETGEDPWCDLRRAASPLQRLPNDSTTSLAAVHGSPTEPAPSFPALVADTDTDAPPPRARTRALLTRLARLIPYALLFLPYVLLVGLAPLVAPARLSALAFAPALGYAPRPRTPLRVFAHHARTLPYHLGAALGALALLCAWSPACGAPAVLGVCAAAWAAWRDFRVDGGAEGEGDAEGEGEEGVRELGADDRVSLYWIVKGVLLGDLVCPMSDLARLCAGEDADGSDVDFAEEEWEEDGAGEDADGDEFAVLREADGSLDCTIRVAGRRDASEMRIIVQCVD